MSACPPEVAASHAPGHRVGRLDVLGPRQPEVSVEAFVLVGVVGDDVIGSTELAEVQLYARARRLPGLDEDEPVSVADDHADDPTVGAPRPVEIELKSLEVLVVTTV